MLLIFFVFSVPSFLPQSSRTATATSSSFTKWNTLKIPYPRERMVGTLFSMLQLEFRWQRRESSASRLDMCRFVDENKLKWEMCKRRREEIELNEKGFFPFFAKLEAPKNSLNTNRRVKIERQTLNFHLFLDSISLVSHFKPLANCRLRENVRKSFAPTQGL